MNERGSWRGRGCRRVRRRGSEKGSWRGRGSGCESSGTEVRHEVGEGMRVENGWEKGDDAGGAAGTEARGSKLP